MMHEEMVTGSTDPADGEEQPGPVGTHACEAEAQLPVEQVLPDEGDEAEGHGCRQHVEHTCHVVDVQLAAHHFILLVVTDACEPQCLQLLHLTCMNTAPTGSEHHSVCFGADPFGLGTDTCDLKVSELHWLTG